MELSKWFIERLNKVCKHNNYVPNSFTVRECDKIGANGSWTPCDLIAREYLNNGCGSAKGFLGLTPSECMECYIYMCANKELILKLDYVNETARNNSGFTLWTNYNFDY